MKQNHIHTRILSTLSLVVTGGLGLLMAATTARASSIVWNGAGDGTTMSSGANWQGGVAPVPGTDSIVFAGTTGLSVNNDITTSSGSAFGGITFNSGAGAFTISGNAIFLSGGITNNSTSLQYFAAKADLNSATRVINAAAGPMQFDLMGSTGSPLLYKEGTNTVTLSGTLDDPGLLCTVTNGVLVLAKGGLGSAVHALGGSTVFNVYTNGTIRFGVSTNEQQIFRNSSIRLEGGTLQVQTTLTNTLLNAITGTNSSTSVVENGLANTTNTLSLGLGANKRAIYIGKIRDGAAPANVLNLAINSSSMYQFDGQLTYSGVTTVSGPSSTVFSRIIINGSHIGGGAYSLFGNNGTVGAALNGRGLISVPVIDVFSNAVVGPGGGLTFNAAAYADSIGMLTLSNTVLNLNATNSALDIQLNGTIPGTGYDQIAMVGSGSFSNNSANLKFSVNPSFIPATGDKFTIVKVPGTNSANNVGVFGYLNGVATDLSQGAVFIDSNSGRAFKISYRAEGSTFDAGAGNGNDIMLQVQSTPGAQIVWRGDVNNVWDVLTTANWRSNGVPNTPIAFGGTDNVTFDDSGSNSAPIDLTGDLSPANITVSAIKDYVFATSGAGKLTGPVVLTKTNSGTLSIVTDNDNTGTSVILGGTLQVGTNGTTGTVSGNVNITPNGVFAYNHSDDKTISTVAFTGTGAFVHNGDGKLAITADLTSGFTGYTTNTGGTLQFGDGSANAGQIGGTVVVPSGKDVHYYFQQDANINNSLSGSGTVTYESVNGGTLTLASGFVNSSNFTGVANIVLGTRVHASGGVYAFGNGSTVNVPANSQAWCDSAEYKNTFNIAGTGWGAPQTGAISVFNAIFTGAINLLADARISGTIAGGTIVCPISGNFQLEVKGNPGSYVLSMGPTNGVHSYASTLITSGTVRALNTNAISTGPLTMDNQGADLRLNGNNLTVASLTSIATAGTTTNATVQNTHGSTAAVLTVGTDNSSTTFDGLFFNGGTAALGLTKVGNGTLTLSATSTNTGGVTVNGGVLALSGSASFGNASAFAIATGASLDVSGRGDSTLTLNVGQTLKHSGAATGNIAVTGNVNIGSGVLLLAVNHAGLAHDNLVTSGTTTFSGTLAVTNNGGPLQVGDSFQLFLGPTPGFTAFNLQTNDVVNNVKYTWNNTVGFDGKVTVASVTASVNTNPTNITYSVSGSNVTLSWPADHTGWTLQTQTNTLAQGLGTNWVNVSGSTTTNQMTFPIGTTNGAVFFRMKY